MKYNCVNAPFWPIHFIHERIAALQYQAFSFADGILILSTEPWFGGGVIRLVDQVLANEEMCCDCFSP